MRVELLGHTRWRGLGPSAALVALLLFLGVTGLGVLLMPIDRMPVSSPAESNQGDLALYRRIVERVRAGEGYYAAATHEGVGAGELDYPRGSVFHWRLPTLAWILGHLPSENAGRLLLGVIGAAGVGVWLIFFARAAPPGTASVGTLMVAGLPLMCAMPSLYLYHEAWAGLLILLAVGCAANRWYGAGVAAGLAACLVRELAVAYAVVALALALRHGRRREAAAWVAVLILFGAAMALHASQITSAATTGAHVIVQRWIAFGGWPFVLHTATLNGWFLLLPPLWMGALLPLALLGLAGWRDEVGERAALTATVYVAAYLIIGRPFNQMWGMLYAGLLPIGVAFAPAALRDLWHSATRRAAQSG